MYALLILAIVTLIIIMLSSCASVPVRPTITPLPESLDFYAERVQAFVNDNWDDPPYTITKVKIIRVVMIKEVSITYIYCGVYMEHGRELIRAAATFVAKNGTNVPKLVTVYQVASEYGI